MVKQHTYWGCGLYAVTNALDMPDFVTDKRLEISKPRGNNITQLTKWLNEDGYDWFILAEYVTGRYFKMPKLYPSSYIDEGTYAPYIIQYPIDKNRHHMIAVRGHADRLQVFDSCTDEAVYFDLAGFREQYPKIAAVYAFVDCETFKKVTVNI